MQPDIDVTYGIHRYVNKDREITKRFVQHAEKRGIKGLFITVDAPQLGRREKVCCAPSEQFLLLTLFFLHRKDMRMKFEEADPDQVSSNDKSKEVDRSQGAARAISVRILSFKDVPEAHMSI